MTDNIDKNEIRRAIDRLQIEHPCSITCDPTAFVNMEAANTIKGCIDKIARRVAEDTEINIICEFAKLYLDGVKPTFYRPRGEWIDESTDALKCSACGKWVYKPFIGGFPTERTQHYNPNYCAFCGAEMRKGGDS